VGLGREFVGPSPIGVRSCPVGPNSVWEPASRAAATAFHRVVRGHRRGPRRRSGGDRAPLRACRGRAGEPRSVG